MKTMSDNENSKIIEYLQELTKESELSKAEICKALKNKKILQKATAIYKDKGENKNDNE